MDVFERWMRTDPLNPTENDDIVALLLLASIGLGLVAREAWLVAWIAVVHGWSSRTVAPVAVHPLLLSLLAPATPFFEWCLVGRASGSW